MRRRWIGAVCAFGLLAIAGATRADQVFIGNLETSETGGVHAPISVKLTLSTEKPKGILKEPNYRYKPLYGSVKLGDAKENETFIVLDAGEKSPRPSLFVDVNNNGDLTDDPSIKLTTPDTDKDRLVATVSLMARYSVSGRGGKVASQVIFSVYGTDVTVNRDYSRAGLLTLGMKTYRIQLLDTSVNARFDDYKHEKGDEEPKVLFLVDRNNDGKFDPLHEAYDAGKPFRVGGQTMTVVAIDPRGMKITLRGTGVKPHPKVLPEDIQVDGDVPVFETDTIKGDIIAFPDDYVGKFVLLHFWSMEDQSSVADLYPLLKTYRKLHPRGLDIVSVSLDRINQTQALKDFVKENELPWDQIYDARGFKSRLATSYGVTKTPFSVLVDGETGKVIGMGDSVRGGNLEPAILAAVIKKIQSKLKQP